MRPDRLENFMNYLMNKNIEIFNRFNGFLGLIPSDEGDYKLFITLGKEYYTEEESDKLFALLNDFLSSKWQLSILNGKI